MYIQQAANPQTIDEIRQYVQSEFARLASELEVTESIRLVVHHSPPDKPSQGDIYYADGTDWNPGTGEGIYVYTSAGWVKL